jgi:hypothetical protein
MLTKGTRKRANGFSIVFSFGSYGGFHWTVGSCFVVLTLGWFAIEVWKPEVIHTIEALFNEIDRLQKHLDAATR